VKVMIGRLLIACVVVAVGSPVHAADSIESRPLQFAKGASSATVKGSLKGDKTIDYKLRAKAGQTMSVTLKTTNGANYFNVLPPGSNDVAIFIGSTSGNEFTGALPADGEYKIRVYLMRSAARRNETADYTLTVGIIGSAAGDAKVGGTSYNANRQGAMSHGKRSAGFAAVRIRCDSCCVRQCRGAYHVPGRFPACAEVRRPHSDLGRRRQGEGQHERRYVVGRCQRPRALPDSRGGGLGRLIEFRGRTAEPG
jgi:hypothetical protein